MGSSNMKKLLVALLLCWCSVAIAADVTVHKLGSVVSGAKNVTIIAEDNSTTLTFDNVNVEFESTDGTQRTWKLTSAKAGNVTLTIEEDLTISDGYAITLAAEDAAGSITLDNALLEIESTDGTQRTFKITSNKAGNTTVTLYENFTIGDGFDGTLTFTASGKTLSVGADSTIDQNLSSGSTVQFAGISTDVATFTQVAFTTVIGDPAFDGTPTIGISIDPDTADGAALGSATKEWSDAYFASGAVVYFQNDQSVTLTADTNGLTVNKNISAATYGSGGSITDAELLTLGTDGSPVFVTAKLSALTNLKVPKHVDDATGLADTTITVSANNEVTNASQPSFMAHLGTTVSNVTGAGTLYTVVFDTELYDQGGGYAVGTGIFTAPATGKYLFTVAIFCTGQTIATQHAIYVYTNTAQGNMRLAQTTRPAGAVDQIITGTLIIDMDATDTIYARIQVTGEGADTVDIYGNATTPNTWFAGFLMH